jgi:hypothetical protein
VTGVLVNESPTLCGCFETFPLLLQNLYYSIDPEQGRRRFSVPNGYRDSPPLCFWWDGFPVMPWLAHNRALTI